MIIFLFLSSGSSRRFLSFVLFSFISAFSRPFLCVLACGRKRISSRSYTGHVGKRYYVIKMASKISSGYYDLFFLCLLPFSLGFSPQFTPVFFSLLLHGLPPFSLDFFSSVYSRFLYNSRILRGNKQQLTCSY